MSEEINVGKKIKISAISIAAGLVVSVAVLMLFAVLVSNIHMPHGVFTLFSTLSLILGGITSGFISGAIHKTKGLLHGLIDGVIFFLIIFIVSFFVSGEIGIVAVLKLAICLLSGMAGGIIGVNRG